MHALVLPDEVVPRLASLCMHYLHGYFDVYEPKPQDRVRPRSPLGVNHVCRGLLLVAILGLALKVLYQDYYLEYLTVRQQLALFGVNVETVAMGVKAMGERGETGSRCSTEYCSDDEADAALLDESQVASEPDLLHAKLQLEERLKHVLRYDFGLESPLPFIERFFECAFSPDQDASGHIANWKALTEEMLKNTTFLRLSHEFHAVYLAAAYLNLTKRYLTPEERQPLTTLPDFIGQHAWFLYVDPAIDQTSLDYVTSVLNDDMLFFQNLVNEPDQPT